MDQNDRMLLRKALTQAFAEKFEEELAVCGETAACSEQHVTAMKAILLQGIRDEQTAERKSRKKWLVAFLVAAALLLTAITVGAHYKEIKAFFEKIYEDHIHLTFNEGEHAPENEGLDKRYTLGYVPEGYTLKREEEGFSSSHLEWGNKEGEYLVFEQQILCGTGFFVDGETGTSTILICGEYKIYCRDYGANGCSYIWNDGVYAYVLDSSVVLSEENLTRMIQNIQEIS